MRNQVLDGDNYILHVRLWGAEGLGATFAARGS
jgi:hypothetical protein